MKRLFVILRQKSPMRNLVVTSLMTFVVLLGVTGCQTTSRNVYAQNTALRIIYCFSERQGREAITSSSSGGCSKLGNSFRQISKLEHDRRLRIKRSGSNTVLGSGNKSNPKQVEEKPSQRKSLSSNPDFNKGLKAYHRGDYETTLRNWIPLAKKGSSRVQFQLGKMYEKGIGVPQDYKTAVKWYRLSANQGDTYAKGRLKTLQRKISISRYAPTVTARKSPPPISSVSENELAKLRRENARLKKKKRRPQPRQYVRKPKPRPSPPTKSGSTGSGFFVSKLGHIITNAHVVRNCGSITVGDNAKKQVATILLETDKRNDLALLKISNTQMASVETKSLISKLGLKLVPTASKGLLRSDDVELGEDVLVSGYPYGEIYSDTIKVTKGIVSANKGIGDDTGQFQMDAAVQPGNSGGPIYDENGNIVGVVVSQLNKLKFAKAIGSLPENVNFGIKASTVRQFLTSSGLPTKWSNRSQRMNTKKLAKIAKNQTVMVKCHP